MAQKTVVFLLFLKVFDSFKLVRLFFIIFPKVFIVLVCIGRFLVLLNFLVYGDGLIQSVLDLENIRVQTFSSEDVLCLLLEWCISL